MHILGISVSSSHSRRGNLFNEKAIYVTIFPPAVKLNHQQVSFFFPQENEKDAIFKILAIILHLGNVDFGKTEVHVVFKTQWLVPRGTVNFVFGESQCFPQQSRGKHWDLRETKFTVAKRPVIKWFLIKQNKTKANFEKCAETPATTSGHLQLHALIMCNSGQHFAGNSELFPVWRHSFCNVARSWHLAGKSFIVRCHVTMN